MGKGERLQRVGVMHWRGREECIKEQRTRIGGWTNERRL
jgi:hypothetical protein